MFDRWIFGAIISYNTCLHLGQVTMQCFLIVVSLRPEVMEAYFATEALGSRLYFVSDEKVCGHFYNLKILDNGTKF